eukprot:7383721-Prymnesium_polylepis.4
MLLSEAKRAAWGLSIWQDAEDCGRSCGGRTRPRIRMSAPSRASGRRPTTRKTVSHATRQHARAWEAGRIACDA